MKRNYCWQSRTLGGLSLVVFMLSALGALFLFGNIAYATSYDWLSPGVRAETINDPLVGTPHIPNHPDQCRWQLIQLGNSFTPLEGCVYEARSFRLAYTTQCIPLWYGGCSYDSFMAISVGSDSKFYRVRNMESTSGSYYWQVSPEEDRLVSSYGRNIVIIDDVVSGIIPENNFSSREYSIKSEAIRYLKDKEGNNVTVGAAAMSRSGEWLAGEAVDIGLFRMNIDTGALKVFTRNTTPYWRGNNPSYEFSITDDGKYVAVGGVNVEAEVYEINDDCGKSNSVFLA